MYSEWTTLSSLVQNGSEKNKDSVLHRLPSAVSKEITQSVVKQLAANLGIAQAVEHSILITNKEVLWCMEVIRYGLSLPLTEHDTIRDCVNIYCEWLSALHSVPKASVPNAVCHDANLFSQKIINDLTNLFVSRNEEEPDTINKQTVLCHRVLRTLQCVAQYSSKISPDTWHCLLSFMIVINNMLLAPSTVKDDVGDQLCERLLSVLFEVWLISCSKCFPSPTMWKTLREISNSWCHRTSLFEQWNRVNLILTSKVLELMYGSPYLQLQMCNEDLQLIINNMSDDCTVQTWFRLLQTIGDPVQLCRFPGIIQSSLIVPFAVSNNGLAEYTCLSILPVNFHNAVKGIASLIDIFLGYSVNDISLARPKCNSILHLFAAWLFEAAFFQNDTINNANSIGLETIKQQQQPVLSETSSINSINSITIQKSGFSQPNSLNEFEDDAFGNCIVEKYIPGRAEAVGVLCRIFCSKKTGEEILPVYLARFYIILQQSLAINERKEFDDVTANVLSNSSDLLRSDLDGVLLLVPYLVPALEFVLSEKKNNMSFVSDVSLRKSCINLLISMLPLPLHFQSLNMKELNNSSFKLNSSFSFEQLKSRLANLLINALQMELDCYNIHMLLGGLLFMIQDCALFEETVPTYQLQLETLIDNGSNVSLDAQSSVSTGSAGGNSDSSTLTDCSFSSISSNSVFDTIGEITSDCSTHNIYFANKSFAYAMFVRTAYLVCHRLISSWKSDLNISLAALELLSALSKIRLHESDVLECKRIVKWLCDYIVYQCWRPPPAHSKDLHSSIVAAFHCAAAWLITHAHLLEETDSLHMLLEVVELGISGTKSQGKVGEAAKRKDEKDLKPASLRVRDAAEALLAVIVEQVNIPSTCGGEIPWILEEVGLVKQQNLLPCVETADHHQVHSVAVTQFQHFVLENNVMISILQETLENKHDMQPKVSILVRNSFGRHAWMLQLRQLPRHRSTSKQYHAFNPGRPISMAEVQVVPSIKQQYFPDDVNRTPLYNVDKSIIPMENMVENDAEDDRLNDLIQQHCESEAKLNNNVSFLEYIAPSSVSEFRTGRLFLSHIGLLFGLSNNNQETTNISPITALNAFQDGFCQDLQLLDTVTAKTYDTCHVFYVRAGQKHYVDILNNALSESFVCEHFLEILLSQGWPVRVGHHAGWSGHTSTSYKVSDKIAAENGNNLNNKDSHGGSLYNGDTHVLYWADAACEIAFIVPTSKSGNSRFQHEPELKEGNNGNSGEEKPAYEKIRNMPVDSEFRANNSEFDEHKTNSGKHRCGLVTVVMLVWLECFEDYLHFPIEELIPYTNTGYDEKLAPNCQQDCFILFLHALQNGLLRIKLRGPLTKTCLATPLIDGMVISRRAAGPLIRQTVINICRRRRIDNDTYQPPHVRRKLKIQEMVAKYKCEMSPPELFSHLLSQC